MLKQTGWATSYRNNREPISMSTLGNKMVSYWVHLANTKNKHKMYDK